MITMKLKAIITSFIVFIAVPSFSQTLDTDALASFPASTQKEVYEICRYVKLPAETQIKLAKALEQENNKFLSLLKANGGALTVKGSNQLNKMRLKHLHEILSEDEESQYWHGVYDEESKAEGKALADKFQKKFNITDQNWKFINVTFYKIGLESRVLRSMMPDNPKEVNKRIAEMRADGIRVIEEKGGILIDPDKIRLKYTRPFRPNDLRKE